MIGIDGVRRQSMISGRGSTDERGTTGSEAIFRIVYGYTSHLGGATSYEFQGGGITYEPNSLDNLESTGQLVVRVKGPATSALAKAQAVAMFPSHPNNSSLGIVRSTVRYDGGGNCSGSAVWVVTLGYGCVKARAYGIVGNEVDENLGNPAATSGTLTIRARGQSSVAAAIVAAATAYPNHPSLAGIPLSGWRGTATENACDGLMTDVVLRYANANSNSMGVAGAMTLAFWQVVYADFEDYATEKMHTDPAFVEGATSFTPHPFMVRSKIPCIRFLIPYNTTSTLLAWVVGLFGKQNNATFAIGGQNFAANQLRFGGAHETVVYDASSGDYKYIHMIEIDACNGWLTLDQMGIHPRYTKATFTVPPVPSVP